MVTKEQVHEYLKQEKEKELLEDQQIAKELQELAASRGRQIIAVIQTHQNGMVASAVWGIQKLQ